MPYVTTHDKTQLYYKDWGKGRPVILLHGWPLSADSWDDHAFAFANAGYRVIAYDRRGFGRSAQPWNGYDYDTLTDDLAEVLKACKVSEASLIGFSMGGGEVARYMSKYSGAGIAQAGLIASIVPYMLKTPDNPNGTEQTMFDGFGAAMQEDRAKFFAEFFKSFYGVGTMARPVSDEVRQASWNVAMQAGLRPTLACAESFAGTDFRPDLASFKVPTLIIHGTADKTVPIDASARAAHQGIRNAKLIEYEGSPHGLLATDKKRVTDDVLKFLNG
ncbi:MAG TPA: alpha/beta hydrolase [Steroidobacteraceae bacterium]|jgi:pimeloyl-ACP methyl ester carboxylesterase|nr:alpha/beta hydrolase [Steroidobacteraceae bacterium]